MTVKQPFDLCQLGWRDDLAGFLADLRDPELEPARLSADHGSRFMMESAAGTGSAELSPVLLKAGERPAVGDWVAVRRRDGQARIEHILPRRTSIARKTPDAATREQVIAANVDVVFIATAIDQDFNLRRIERLLTVAYQSGAAPVILLTKVDLADPEAFIAEVEAATPGVPVLSVSAISGDGLDAVRAHVPSGKTGVLVGSSGVGKSTLINRLINSEALRTAEVHSTGQGRHTTTHRQLLVLPNGGLMIDTPGLREIQLWAGDDRLAEVFADIETLARTCRFNDCRHDGEPECAVGSAIETGTLDAARLASYRKLLRELRSIEVRADVHLQIEERRKWKTIHRAARERTKAKRRLG